MTGIATNPMALIFIVLFQKFQIPIPKSQATFNRQILKKQRRYPLLDIIDAKINVNSRASAASPSRVAILLSLDRFPLIAGIADSLWLLCGTPLLVSQNH